MDPKVVSNIKVDLYVWPFYSVKKFIDINNKSLRLYCRVEGAVTHKDDGDNSVFSGMVKFVEIFDPSKWNKVKGGITDDADMKGVAAAMVVFLKVDDDDPVMISSTADYNFSSYFLPFTKDVGTIYNGKTIELMCATKNNWAVQTKVVGFIETEA